MRSWNEVYDDMDKWRSEQAFRVCPHIPTRVEYLKQGTAHGWLEYGSFGTPERAQQFVNEQKHRAES